MTNYLFQAKTLILIFTFLFQATPVPQVSSVPKEVKKITPPIKTAEVSYTKSTYLYTF